MAEGHIRQRGTAWEIRYEIGTDPVTGRRKTKTETVRGTKREAQKLLRDRLSALDAGTFADPGKLTVVKFLEQWLDHAETQVSAKTFERYAEITRKHLIPALGALPLAKLRPVHIQAHYSEALKTGRRDGKGGLSARTVGHHDRVLNTALVHARRLRLIATNPCDDVERPRVEAEEIQILAPEDARALLASARPTRLWLPIFLVLGTGLRRGEVLALRYRDIDLASSKLTVNQSLEQTAAGLRFKSPKTKRGRRVIDLSPSVVEALQAHRLAHMEERMQLGLGKPPSDGLVFTKIIGEPISPRDFSKEFSRIADRAGCGHVTFHGLRHTHLTDLLIKGINVKVVSERAGHASAAVTLDVYGHVIPGLQAEAAAGIDAALRDLVSGDG